MTENADSLQETTAWSVWRTDDTGNTFLVRENLTHEESLRLVAEFEARGHKQTYFVEREKR
jgi:UDP-N-acetyl-2-amino-2-deoxyglucuronate dehydrogenase